MLTLVGADHAQKMQRVEIQRVAANNRQALRRLAEDHGSVMPCRFGDRCVHHPWSGGGVLPARMSATVARVVIWSGFMRNSMTAGLPLSTARRNAGANAAVSLTTSP